MLIELNDAIFANQQLVGREKIVLLAIARHVNKPGQFVFPAIRTIADAAGLKRSHVSRIIKGLALRGTIIVRDNGGPRKSATYDLGPLMSPPVGHNQGEGGADMSPNLEVMSPPRQVMSPLDGTESSKNHPKENHINSDIRTDIRKAFQQTAQGILAKITPDLRPATADLLHLQDAAKGNAAAWRSWQCSICPTTLRFREKTK